MAGQPWHRGRRWAEARALCLAQSTVCYLCGHDGADTADHKLSPTRGGAWFDQDNLGPAHGVKGCPTCRRKCNREKGVKTVAEFAPLRTSRTW